MKALLFILLAALGFGAVSSSGETTTLILKNGNVYRNVKITRETDDAIYVRYNAGMVKIFKTQLSAEMQRAYPTAEQKAQADAEKRQRETAEASAAQQEAAALNLTRIKSRHPKLIERVTRPVEAEREIKGMYAEQPVSWKLSFDESAEHLVFLSRKMPTGGKPEWRFAVDVPTDVFQDLVSLVLKFEDWCSICSKETPKPTVEKVIGTLDSVECVFRYNREAGGALWIGDNVMQEDDAKTFLALSTAVNDLTAERREIQKRNDAVTERLQ